MASPPSSGGGKAGQGSRHGSRYVNLAAVTFRYVNLAAVGRNGCNGGSLARRRGHGAGRGHDARRSALVPRDRARELDVGDVGRVRCARRRAAAIIIFPPRLASSSNMIQKHRHELDVGRVRVHGGERVGAKFAERGGESRARGGARKRRGCWGARPNDRTRSDVTESKIPFWKTRITSEPAPPDDP